LPVARREVGPVPEESAGVRKFRPLVDGRQTGLLEPVNNRRADQRRRQEVDGADTAGGDPIRSAEGLVTAAEIGNDEFDAETGRCLFEA
jgi:hypothetical protein